MKKRTLLLLLLSAVGCDLRKPADLDFPWDENVLAVRGFISLQEGVRVDVGKLLAPTAVDESDVVSGVTVSLLKNGEVWVQLRETRPGRFMLPEGEAVEADLPYQLRVEAPGYPSVLSEAVVPPEPVSVAVRYIPPTVNTISLLRWEFQDPAQQVNHYQYEVYRYLNGRDLEGAVNDQYFISPILILDDREFDGRSVVFDEGIWLEEGIGDQAVFIDSMGVGLFHLGPHLAEYFLAVEQQILNGSNPFLEPPVLPNNLSGGYGFFGGYSYSQAFISPP